MGLSFFQPRVPGLCAGISYWTFVEGNSHDWVIERIFVDSDGGLRSDFMSNVSKNVTL